MIKTDYFLKNGFKNFNKVYEPSLDTQRVLRNGKIIPKSLMKYRINNS